MDWSLHMILAAAGGLCGVVGSITTAFSFNRLLVELRLAQGFLEVTVEALVTEQSPVPVFTGLERRIEKAKAHGSTLVGFGASLLVLSFILQAVSILLG